MATLAPAGQAPSRYLALSRRRLAIAAVTLVRTEPPGSGPSERSRASNFHGT